MAGVAYLHATGCVHNDLKPDNILMMEKFTPKNVPRAVIGDYGWITNLGTSHRQ